ncbi:hypothetical protein GGR56DRAFT_593101 [Xylariaceae sp. FL0804]|nr:hypothetical protein GGR56DRAFT_593101 [Xylariaceae sp. FL0804]
MSPPPSGDETTTGSGGVTTSDSTTTLEAITSVETTTASEPTNPEVPANLPPLTTFEQITSTSTAETIPSSTATGFSSDGFLTTVTEFDSNGVPTATEVQSLSTSDGSTNFVTVTSLVPTAPPSSIGSADTSTAAHSASSTLSGSAIAGIVIGAILGVAVVSVLSWLVYHYRRKALGTGTVSAEDGGGIEAALKGGHEHQKPELEAGAVAPRYELEQEAARMRYELSADNRGPYPPPAELGDRG